MSAARFFARPGRCFIRVNEGDASYNKVGPEGRRAVLLTARKKTFATPIMRSESRALLLSVFAGEIG